MTTPTTTDAVRTDRRECRNSYVDILDIKSYLKIVHQRVWGVKKRSKSDPYIFDTPFRLLPSPFATNATVILKILAEAYEISENFQIQLRYIGILKLHSKIRNCNLVGLS